MRPANCAGRSTCTVPGTGDRSRLQAQRADLVVGDHRVIRAARHDDVALRGREQRGHGRGADGVDPVVECDLKRPVPVADGRPTLVAGIPEPVQARQAQPVGGGGVPGGESPGRAGGQRRGPVEFLADQPTLIPAATVARTSTPNHPLASARPTAPPIEWPTTTTSRRGPMRAETSAAYPPML